MKGIIWNCKQVSWKYTDQDQEITKDCLLVYICWEKEDSYQELKEAARRINQLNKKRYMKNRVVIFPYAHLSNSLLDKDQAKNLIDQLRIALQKNVDTSILKFDHDKEIAIHLLPTNNDVSFFSY